MQRSQLCAVIDSVRCDTHRRHPRRAQASSPTDVLRGTRIVDMLSAIRCRGSASAGEQVRQLTSAGE